MPVKHEINCVSPILNELLMYYRQNWENLAMKLIPFNSIAAKFKGLSPFTIQNPKFKIKNSISSQAILSIFIFSLGSSFSSQNYLVLAQISSPHAKAAEQIKQRILYNQQFKIKCRKIKEIEFELARD